MQFFERNNKKKKELFIIRTRLSYYKVFHRKSVSNRNEKSKNIYEWISIFRALNTRIKYNIDVWVWYYCIKLKYAVKVKLSYMDKDSCITYMKTTDICKNIVENVKRRFDTSSY